MNISITSSLGPGPISNQTTTSYVAPYATQRLCRTRFGYYAPRAYNLLSCALCFQYVYVDMNVSFNASVFTLVAGEDMPYPPGTAVEPDISNEDSVRKVCGLLDGKEECWKWKGCCRQAMKCCQQQIDDGPMPIAAYGHTTCPRTWDGYHCFRDTPAKTTVHVNCPAYVLNADTDNKAFKVCDENGTWYRDPKTSQEWTDYRACHDLGIYKRLHTAGVTCNIITIVLLVPACFIFLYFKQLRHQHRIRLHLCLMLSSLINSLSMLLWEIVIFRDRLYTLDMQDSVIQKNSVACRILNVATRYSLTANFMWMFIEGFHLHRLLVHAFSAPKTLIPYYIFGYGFPWLPIITYVIIRGVNDDLNLKCWVDQAGHFEWILYTPILVVLVVNVFFLLRIVFIMIKQLEPHPNEPSNFRRAAKAVGVLVPLFGVQFILFVYRPQGGAFAEFFELLNKILSSLQGAFIAIVFCYCNKEVQTHLKALCFRFANRRGNHRGFSMHGGSFTVTSQYNNTDATRTRYTNGYGDSSHMIPLQKVGWQDVDENNTTKGNNQPSASLLEK